MSDHHTHDWQPSTDGWACTACIETSATCNACSGPTGSALLACRPCLDHHARVLDDIADALGHWRHQPRSVVPAIRYDRDRIRGSRADGQHRTGVQDVIDVLWSWVAMWEELSGLTVGGDAVDRLKSMHMWAVHHPDVSAWHDYAVEVRQLRHAARRLAGLLPQRQAGPCVHCGGQVVRDWADERWQPLADGLSDTLRCTGCGTVWGDRAWWQQVNRTTVQALPLTHPDRLVTIEEAWAIFPDVPTPTWRKWRERDDERDENERRMPVRSWDVRGRPLYLLADLTAMVERRSDESRRGAKVS